MIFLFLVVLESKLGHDPVVTSSQENVMKYTASAYACKPSFSLNFCKGEHGKKIDESVQCLHVSRYGIYL